MIIIVRGNSMKFSFKKSLTAVSVAALFAMTTQANATLIKSGGLIYDDESLITWLADTNYSKTDGTDNDGKMLWDDSKTWAVNLDAFGSIEWRLPTLIEALALQSSSANFGLFDNLPGAFNVAQYWTSTENFGSTDERAYWFRIDGTSGPVKTQGTAKRFAWAVVDGDFENIQGIGATVPEPASMGIFALGLAGLAYRRKQLQTGKKVK